jgi:Ca-activated chloride channel family protein
MFRFESNIYFILLTAIPLLILLYYTGYKRRKVLMKKLGDIDLIQGLIKNYSIKRIRLKQLLTLTSMFFLTLAMVNPQWGTKKEKIKSTSADIYIALDISNSMMATDISPSRLERTKRFSQKLIEDLKGNRVGLVFFAGSAYLQMPLTNDIAAAQVMVKSANTNLAGTQGTAIGDAIELAIKANPEEEPHPKAIVIISDGENHDSDAVQAAKKAAENGAVIYTVGVGTEAGGFIPIVNRGREEYKKDKSGNPVKTGINIEMLQNVARAGNGEFFLINDGEKAIASLLNGLQKLQKREIEQRSFTEYGSYFQYFLIIALLLLIIELMLSDFAIKNQKRVES